MRTGTWVVLTALLMLPALAFHVLVEGWSAASAEYDIVPAPCGARSQRAGLPWRWPPSGGRSGSDHGSGDIRNA